MNKLVLEGEVVIGASLIEPHFFAGYSAAVRCFSSGFAGEEIIFNNHGYRMVDDSRARAGILEGNPIHEDMLEFMTHTKLDFVVNVTIDRERRDNGIFAGDPVKAHLKGVSRSRTARDLLLEHARTLKEALEIAYGIVGRDARTVAIPEGPYVIPVIG